MLWRMAAEPHLDKIGIMIARLDNLPQRHRSVTLHAAAPDDDFRTSMRCERIPGRHHAKPPAIGISLAEIAETLGMARPSDTATESRVGRKGRKGRKPIFRAL